MSIERWDGYDEDSKPMNPRERSDAEVDALIDERQQREIEEFSAERINAAIRIVNENLKVPT